MVGAWAARAAGECRGRRCGHAGLQRTGDFPLLGAGGTAAPQVLRRRASEEGVPGSVMTAGDGRLHLPRVERSALANDRPAHPRVTEGQGRRCSQSPRRDG